MRSVVISQMRRRVGITAVQAMARHRLVRERCIGMPRAYVERGCHGSTARAHPRRMRLRIPGGTGTGMVVLEGRGGGGLRRRLPDLAICPRSPLGPDLPAARLVI